VSPLQTQPKELVGTATPTNNRTVGIETNHSTMFTLLLELNVVCEQRWIQFELQNRPSRGFAFDGKIYITIWQTCEIGSQLKFLINSE